MKVVHSILELDPTATAPKSSSAASYDRPAIFVWVLHCTVCRSEWVERYLGNTRPGSKANRRTVHRPASRSIKIDRCSRFRVHQSTSSAKNSCPNINSTAIHDSSRVRSAEAEPKHQLMTLSQQGHKPTHSWLKVLRYQKLQHSTPEKRTS